jgi:DMSO reductase anchor subunit
MCTGRLASGEAPACVQACPNEAIRITFVSQAETVEQFTEARSGNTFLPGSPAPNYTFPTTRYVSAKPLPDSLRPADAQELQPQPAHTPLGMMLVLSQLSVGVFTAERLLSISASQPLPALRPWLTVVALLLGLAALGASTTHLGRPLGAWRAFLGLRKSWLSREIVVFGQFAGVAMLYTTAVWFPKLLPSAVVPSLGWATVGSGLLGVFCSAMIYHDTHRDFWHLRWSGAKFFGTTFLLGTATTLLIAALLGGEATTLIPVLSAITAVAGVLKLATELPIFRHLETEDWSPLHKSALLLHGPFGLLHRWRVGLGIGGGVVMPLWLALDSTTGFSTAWPIAAVILATTLAGEWIERRLFFTAVQPVKMPGGVSA